MFLRNISASVASPETPLFRPCRRTIRGVILWRDGVIPIDGANMMPRPITGIRSEVYELAQAMQAGTSHGEYGGRGDPGRSLLLGSSPRC